MAHTTTPNNAFSGPTLPQPQAQPLRLLRMWFRRASRRQALRSEFAHASPQWLARIERDIGLEPGQLSQEMHKPFWSD